jgi:hypothetical protein
MKDNNIKITDPSVGEKMVELCEIIFQNLPQEQQEKIWAELNGITFPEENDTRKRLLRWTMEELILPLCLGLLMMFVVRLYFSC